MSCRIPRFCACFVLLAGSTVVAQTPEMDALGDDEPPVLQAEAPGSPPTVATEEGEPFSMVPARRRRRAPPVRVAAGSLDAAAPAMARGGDAPDPYEWFLVPLAGYSSDIGAAGALLGMLYHYEPGYEPFRDKVQLITLLTHKLVQFHELIWERVGLFNKPLRLELAASFTATPVGHYCGLGNEVDCDPAAARVAAQDAGIMMGEEGYNRFLRQYYRFRVMRPAGRMRLRWEPVEGGAELTLGWETSYSIPGYFGDRDPFPGSLYAQDYPDGEQGFLSELAVGVVLDRRNHERRPTRGYIVAANLRGSGKPLGSEWTYGGANVQVAGYLPLSRNHRLVSATRAVVDLLIGDPPTTVMGSLGGFWNDTAYGGQAIGRGIRARRYIGRIKAMAQTELRWAMFGEPGEFQGFLAVYGDVGWIGVDYDDWGGSLDRFVPSFGGALGIYWGQSFLLRFDVGLSPVEDYEPQFYLGLRHPY